MLRVAIVGASGYTGAELMRWLAGHTKAELSIATANQYAGKRASELYPSLIGTADAAFVAYDATEVTDQSDVVFVAVPHGEAMKIVPELVAAGCKVVDLSGDFRFRDVSIYEQWYGYSHSAPELVGRAVYGLPELNGAAIRKADLIANPGCYPTAVILGLAPLLDAGLVFEEDIVVTALTGVSGSGRMPNQETHFCTMDENLVAYKPGGVHQHIPEMEQELSKLAGARVKVSFTPVLAPLSRAIYATIYCDLKEDVELDEVHAVFTKFYTGKPFVVVLELGSYPEAKAVQGTNFCHIGVALDDRTGRVVVMSAIDNLGKGASTQAIQNMNLMCGLPEEEGVTARALYP